jgi:hypothetical protein
MDIDKKYIDIAKDVCNNIHKLDIASTHEPPSIAAGCILLVANTYNINISKKQISEIFDISDVTISKTYRKIHPYYKIILNNKVTDLILQKKNAMINPDKNEISENNLVLKEQLKKELLEDIKEYDSEIESDSDSDTDTYNNEEIESFTNKETESFTNKETESFTNKETESFTNKETESFNNKETEIETETEIEIEKPIKKINNKKKKNLEI